MSRRIAAEAIASVWWVICLPFIAFKVLGSKIVPAPLDVRPSREEMGRDRDLLVESLANTPPPNAG